MTDAEKETITDLKKCDFREINEYYKKKGEERKAMSKEEKLKIKEENEELLKIYGICILDGHKEKIGNFRIEPPGLFRGRGEHPKMGMLKTRVMPEDVIINCSKDANIPSPPKGHKWKEVRHDNTVSWLACWTENVQVQCGCLRRDWFLDTDLVLVLKISGDNCSTLLITGTAKVRDAESKLSSERRKGLDEVRESSRVG